MSDYSTISIKKSFLENEHIQKWMNDMGYDSVSEASRSAIRLQAHSHGNGTQKILNKVLKKADLTEQDYKEIIQEISQD